MGKPEKPPTPAEVIKKLTQDERELVKQEAVARIKRLEYMLSLMKRESEERREGTG
jgi:hypothetical protein